MFEFLAVYLKENAGLTPEELKLVEELTVVKKLRKRQYLLQEGDLFHYHCFIAKGCLRMYRLGEDGTEHILRFGIENWWMSDFESCNTGNPAKNNIDALEDSELLLIKKENLNTLLKAIPNLQDFKEKIDANCFDLNQNRILSNLRDTAEEKYENFINSYPQFYNRVPMHMIAAYLGVSRKTLSRARNKQAIGISI